MEFLRNIPFGGWAAIVAGILSIIQITPIQICPWTWLGKIVGNFINQDVMKKQKEIQEESQEYRKNNDIRIAELNGLIADIKSDVGEVKAEYARNRILQFGDEIKNKQRHSEEYYNQILYDITFYEQYCNEHPDFQNERTVSTKKIIKEAYENHLRNNDFL